MSLKTRASGEVPRASKIWGLLSQRARWNSNIFRALKMLSRFLATHNNYRQKYNVTIIFLVFCKINNLNIRSFSRNEDLIFPHIFMISSKWSIFYLQQLHRRRGWQNTLYKLYQKRWAWFDLQNWCALCKQMIQPLTVSLLIYIDMYFTISVC